MNKTLIVYYLKKSVKSIDNFEYFINYGIDKSKWNISQIYLCIITDEIELYQKYNTLKLDTDLFIIDKSHLPDELINNVDNNTFDMWFASIKYLFNTKNINMNYFTHLMLLTSDSIGPIFEFNISKQWLDRLYKFKLVKNGNRNIESNMYFITISEVNDIFNLKKYYKITQLDNIYFRCNNLPDDFNWYNYSKINPKIYFKYKTKEEIIFHYIKYGLKEKLEYIYSDNQYKTDGKSNILPLTLFNLSYYKTCEHRGGWNDIITKMIDSNIITTSDTGKYLIDQPLTTFYKEKKYMTNIFFIFIHETINVDSEDYLSIKDLLLNEYYQKSIDNCKGIITFSDYCKNEIQLYCPNIPVLSIKHPILMDNIVEFNLNNFFSYKYGIVLLGSQLRNIYNFFSLDTNIKKYWLPGTIKYFNQKFNVAKKNLEHNNIILDESIEIMYFKDFSDYDNFITTNIILIDLYDANANNAIIECIARNIPFFVNKIEAVVEYIGEDYPLYFKTKEDIELYINDPILLKDIYFKTYLYIKNLDKSYLNISNFCEKVHNFINSNSI